MNNEPQPRFLDAGEAALVVEFGTSVDPAVHDRVLGLDLVLSSQPAEGILETVPTFRSLMIHYDPLVLGRAALIELVLATLQMSGKALGRRSEWIVPCCYAPEFAEDVPYLSEQLGLSVDRIVALHSQAQYRLYMYGFAPGTCYLGGLPVELTISRRIEPRPPAPENVVITAAGMSAIVTYAMPTGWWLVGRTPERMFSIDRDPQVFIQVGETIRFEPVGLDEFRSLDERSKSGEIVSRKRS